MGDLILCKDCYWSAEWIEADRGKILICENPKGLHRDVLEKDYCSCGEVIEDGND